MINSMCLWLLTLSLAGFNVRPQYALSDYYQLNGVVSGSGSSFLTLPSIITTSTTRTTTRSTTRPTTTSTTTTRRSTISTTRPSSTTTRRPAALTSTATLIDPRFGEQLQDQPPINFENPPNENIYFPRNKRSVDEGKTRTKRQSSCGCYTPSMCLVNPIVTLKANGTREFDVEYIANQIKCAQGLQYCCPTNSQAQTVACGARIRTTVTYPTQSGQAKYGDYPWMAVLLTTDNFYVGGGVLIDLQHVLTTAHRITNYANGAGLKVRLGEWDSSANYEQYPFRDFTISRLWMHESFNALTLQNDVALIRMSIGIPVGTSGITPICMPSSGQIFDGQRCWVSGWGKDAFGINGQYQKILKQVDVPILTPSSCETSLKATRLGTAYTLDRASFICAGGELNKDACTGDGGSGLVCEVTTGRWVLAGLVAWGLGCASQGVPAAYVNVVNYLPWITAKQASK